MAEQMGLGIDNLWEEEWKGMPEFKMTPEVPILTIKISFKSQQAIDDFSAMFGQRISHTMENYWFPKLNRQSTSPLVYVDKE